MTIAAIPDPVQLRDELEVLNRKLLLHNRNEELLTENEYRVSLLRSLEIVGSMNTTIATPKTTKKISGPKKTPSPVNLDDL